MEQNNTKQNDSKNYQHEDRQGIARYYQRTQQGQYGNCYYIEPRQDCPLDVLNDRTRFVIVNFDKLDNYLVIAGKRYYLNHVNSIKGTDKVRSRIAVVDLHELKKSKAYDFDNKFARRYTACFASFDELKQLARQQWLENGAPYIKQTAIYNEDTQKCSYYYTLSFSLGARKVI